MNYIKKIFINAIIMLLWSLNIYGDVIVYLTDDWVIPASTTIPYAASTIIDGQGHDIVFSDESVLKVDGSAGTRLTLRNCNVKGISTYTSGNSSIMFGSAAGQTFALNDVVFNLAGDFEFTGGGLEIKNEVKIKGLGKWFVYKSDRDIYINSDSTMFIDFHVVFFYNPSDKKSNHIVMESSSSGLYLNGCTFVQGDDCGLVLIYGHLIVDHLVHWYNTGNEKKSWALWFGNGKEYANLNIDILPSANFDVEVGGLIYSNVDNINY